MAPTEEQEFGMKRHWKALLIVSFVSLSSFQYGVDFGIIGGLQAMVGFLQVFGQRDPSTPIGWNISAERQQLISSLMILGAFISSFTAGFTARYFGRKVSLWIACVGVFVATALMQSTTSIGGVYAGRVIIGLANGLLMTHAQLYIQECSPAQYRGFGISLFTYWVSVGSLVGTVVDNFAAKILNKNAYIIPLGVVHVVPFILTIGLFFIPESPRWLATSKSSFISKTSGVRLGSAGFFERVMEECFAYTRPGGRMSEAERALRRLRPQGWSISKELDEMNRALDAEIRLQSSVGYATLFRNPVDRRRTIISVLALTTQAASGSMFVISYGTYFFEMANVGNAFENSCILTGVGVAALLFNTSIITKYGRRRVMMLTGFILCGLAQLGMGIAYTVEPGSRRTGKVIVGLSVLYVVSYSALVNTYAWLCGGELASQRLRSHTFGLATAVGFLGAWLIAFTAPYFINPAALGWGPKYCFVWTGSCAVTAGWIWAFLPEVQGRTLEEIDEMFEAGVDARKFRKYQCRRPREVKFESMDEESRAKDLES